MGTIIPATWMAYSLPLQDDQTEAAIYQTAPQLSPATFKLYEAIGQHDTSTVQDVLKNGTSPNSRHPDGYTPLNACTYANNAAATVAAEVPIPEHRLALILKFIARC